jgi:hypothetical protein
MNGTTTIAFVDDADRVSPIGAPWSALARRVAGRFARDPFGLDPQLADLVTPLARLLVPVDVDGAEHVGRGGATLVMNRGFGVFEPSALAVAIADACGRRVRTVGAPGVAGLGDVARRFGAIAASVPDVGAALRAGHLVVLPLGLTWFRTGAGTPPLELVQALRGHPVHPVAVRPGGPFNLALRPWQVRIGAPLTVDDSYADGDPLAAADLAEAARAAVDALLTRN